MAPLIAALLFLAEPEDRCDLYLMDMSWATYSSDWDHRYDSSLSAFRSLQGCLDLSLWYITYEIKFDRTFYKRFRVRYRHYRLEDYETMIDIHRFEPCLRIKDNFFGHLMITPNFAKENDEIGIGGSLFEDPLNYVEGFFIVKEFDNNFSKMHTDSGPERDVYIDWKWPYKFTVEASKKSERTWLKIYLEYVTQARKELQDPNRENHRIKNFSSAAALGRLEWRAFNNFCVGNLFDYRYSGEEREYRDIGIEPRYDTLRTLTIEPYILSPFHERFSLNISYRYTLKWHDYFEKNGDTLGDLEKSYKRRWSGPSLLLEYALSKGVKIGFGFQRSTRVYETINVEVPKKGHVQNRAQISLEFTFPQGMGLWIREGIELDGFPLTTFSPFSFHNHTYAALFVPF